MYSRDPRGGGPPWDRAGAMGGGPRGRPPRDIIILLAVLFITFTLQFFESTALFPALLRLTPLVWQRGMLWQLLTYAFAGTGGPGIWFLIELLILYWFASDVYAQLGRGRFGRLLALGILTASLSACLFHLGLGGVGGLSAPIPFVLMQGQRMLIAVLIAAFATLNGQATIYLMFVLPVQARFFIAIEIVLAFFGFLSTRDGAGFVGLCAGVGASWAYLAPGGPRRRFRQWRLKWKRRKVERELRQLRRQRDLRVVRDDDEDGPPSGGWVN